eukprot:TRINITY_DN8771_c0_g1_i1.p1 TRINITY_DN8771_c0_g1~~TRINITY_DN8771_c0_g1_i1.p1  ORF type:complete len:256 (+),score=52.12 TRINITY_DN8771_c0_g1_i1:82-849(+)
MNYLDSVPEWILLKEIIHRLSSTSILSMAKACKRVSILIKEDDFWKEQMDIHYGSTKRMLGKDWKETFFILYNSKEEPLRFSLDPKSSFQVEFHSVCGLVDDRFMSSKTLKSQIPSEKVLSKIIPMIQNKAVFLERSLKDPILLDKNPAELAVKPFINEECLNFEIACFLSEIKKPYFESFQAICKDYIQTEPFKKVEDDFSSFFASYMSSRGIQMPHSAADFLSRSSKKNYGYLYYEVQSDAHMINCCVIVLKL